MSNPVYDTLVGAQQNNPQSLIQQFQKFRREMQGKNPTEEINRLLQSGMISQQHLDRAQQMANQMPPQIISQLQNLFKGPIY